MEEFQAKRIYIHREKEAFSLLHVWTNRKVLMQPLPDASNTGKQYIQHAPSD